MGYVRHDDRSDIKGEDHVIQSADMILMGVSPDQIIQLCQVQRVKIVRNRATAFVGPRVHQHGMLPRLDQDGIALPHVDEVYPQISVGSGKLRQSGDGLPGLLPVPAFLRQKIGPGRRGRTAGEQDGLKKQQGGAADPGPAEKGSG